MNRESIHKNQLFSYIMDTQKDGKLNIKYTTIYRTPKNIKYLRINLIENVKVLYTENEKHLLVLILKLH